MRRKPGDKKIIAGSKCAACDSKITCNIPQVHEVSHTPPRKRDHLWYTLRPRIRVRLCDPQQYMDNHRLPTW